MLNRSDLVELMHRHQAELYRYLCYLGAGDTDAEDLLQDAFLAALEAKKHPPVCETMQCGAWLRGIARNLFYQHCRRQRSSPLFANSELVEKAEAYWAESYLGASDGFDYMESLRKCLKRLSEKQQTVVRLFYRDRLSRADTAAQVDLSEHGVKKLLQRVRLALADCVKHRLQEEAGS